MKMLERGLVSRNETNKMIRLIEDKSRHTASLAGNTCDVPASAQRALVALAPIAAVQLGATPVKRPAAFLAQLIAVKDGHPQTRERRRAEPGEAIAAYRAVAERVRR